MLLHELIAFCNGKCNPICGFSAKELKRATNNYDQRQFVHENRFFKFYKGFVRDQQPVLIKKFKGNFQRREVVFNEIVIASVMSIHKNALKLLGCCLETKVPTLVFEFAECGQLDDQISSKCHCQPLSWSCRLKIAMEIANVVTYLHSAFPKPVIHRNILCLNIFLTEHCTAKLSDFSVCMPVSDVDELIDIEDPVEGIAGLTTAEFMAKHDVYSVGIVLLMLLTGQSEICKDPHENNRRIYLTDYVKKYALNNNFNDILDPNVYREEMLAEKEPQMEAFKQLAMKCICELAADRPTITDVAKELRRIYQMQRFKCSHIIDYSRN